MALHEVVFQHDHIYNYNDLEAYNETPFHDLQGSLSFLDNQTQNYESTLLLQDQEDYYENAAATFLHQPLPENIVTNEARMTSSCHWDSSEINATNEKKQATRRRARVKKNKEEINSQRMTHITVERNRRKLMNEYLSVLRSLMPDSYVQRCDQASIVGGAINFIRELEHRLHNFTDEPNEISLSEPFSDTLKLPQFSMCSCPVNEHVSLGINALADIEVSLVESYASIKIRSRKRPKLLLCLVSGLQSLGFITLHLNVSTSSDFILYCFSTKMEDYCKLTSVADIATAVHEMIKIHNDSS